MEPADGGGGGGRTFDSLPDVFDREIQESHTEAPIHWVAPPVAASAENPDPVFPDGSGEGSMEAAGDGDVGTQVIDDMEPFFPGGGEMAVAGDEAAGTVVVDDSDLPFPDGGTSAVEGDHEPAAGTEAVDDSNVPFSSGGTVAGLPPFPEEGEEFRVVSEFDAERSDAGNTSEGVQVKEEKSKDCALEVDCLHGEEDTAQEIKKEESASTSFVKEEDHGMGDESAQDDDGRAGKAGYDDTKVIKEEDLEVDVAHEIKKEEDRAEGTGGDHTSQLEYTNDHCKEEAPLIGTDGTMIIDDEDLLADMRLPMEVEMDEEPIVATTRAGAGRKRRGRPPKNEAGPKSQARGPKFQAGRSPDKKKEEEDVCFICFDGGQLVLCDHRGCPKAYHAACVNREESFFRSKGRWNCGWHICSVCEKSAQFMCYTCTASFCKACVKEAAGFICVRGNKGFCETCMSTVIMLENSMQETDTAHDFNDKSNWMYMFKEYWLNLKGKLSLSLDELDLARTSRKGSYVSSRLEESSDELYDDKNDQGASSDSSLGRRKGKLSSGKKLRKRLRKNATEDIPDKEVESEVTSTPGTIPWASKELLDLVAYMKNGDKAALSQFDVQSLLLLYIKQNNLRDPRKKSQIKCDSMLQNLFGKPQVAHFEMLKLLESHFLIKENPQLVTEDNSQGGVVDPDSSPVDADGYSDASTKMSSDKTHKTRIRLEERELRYNHDDYAAIDVHNISLIYLRRNLVEQLIDNDADVFHEKVFGAFVRIKIMTPGSRHDSYRLVQVTGTSRRPEKYKTGKRTTDIFLEVLNLKKTESISIDIISNQEFTEEECKRLRQSIKCGLYSRLTVGDVQEKARRLHSIKVHDLLENEKSRLSHLRDRANEQGRKKQLRECVEKINLLSKPEERLRRLNKAPDIHVDPKMDPTYESAEDEVEPDNKRGGSFGKQMEYTPSKNTRELPSPTKGVSVPSSGWNGQRQKGPISNWDSTGNVLSVGALDRSHSLHLRKGMPEASQVKDVMYTSQPSLKIQVNATGSDLGDWNANQSGPIPTQSSAIPPESVSSIVHTGHVASPNLKETEKIWHYEDPSGKIQGPFSMAQLRKWNINGYFPPDLKIWKASGKKDDSVLLSDTLNENKQKGSSEDQQNTCQPTKTTELIGSGQGISVSNWQGHSQGSCVPMVSDNRENSGPWSHYQNDATVRHYDSGAPRTGALNSSQSWNACDNVSISTVAAQDHSNPRPSSSFLGNMHRSPPYQARGGHGGSSGRWHGRSTWNSNRPRAPQLGGQHYRRQGNWNSPGPQSSAGQWNSRPENAPSNNQWGSGWSSQHINPEQGSAGWTVQGSSNQFTSTNFNQLHRTPSGWVNHSGGNLANQTLISAHATNPTTQPTYSFNGWSSNSAPVSMPTTVGVGGTVNVQLPERLPVSGNLQVSSQQNLPESGRCQDMMTADRGVPTYSSAENRNTLAAMQSVGSECPSPTPESETQTGNVLCSDGGTQYPAFTTVLAATSDVPSSTSKSAKLQVNATISPEGVSKHNPLDQMGNSTIQCDSSKGTVVAPDSDSRVLVPKASSHVLLADDSKSSLENVVHRSGSRPDSDAQVWSPISVPKQGPQGFSLPAASAANISQQNQSKNTESSFQQYAGENSGRQEVPLHVKMPAPAASVTSSRDDGANVPSGSNTGVSGDSMVQSSTGLGVVSQNPNAVPISTQGDRNLGWGSTAVQGNMNAGWGAVMPNNVNMAWGIPAAAQGNVNVNLGFVAPAQTSPNVNPSWVMVPQDGSINPNMAWVNAAQANVNPNTNVAVPVQGAALVNPSWGAAAPGTTSMVMVDVSQNSNWAAPVQSGQSTNAGGSYSGQGNANQTWDPSAGNSSQWNAQHKQHRDSTYGQREGGYHRYDRGHDSGRPAWNRNRSGSLGPSHEDMGFCWFFDQGHCSKGSRCNYVHR